MAKSKNQKILHLVLLLATLVMSRIITCKLKKAVGFFDKREKRKGESVGGQIARSFWVGESLGEMEMRWILFILLVCSKDKVFHAGQGRFHRTLRSESQSFTTVAGAPLQYPFSRGYPASD